MIQLDIVLYRFVCDISTFAGLFAEDAEGRSIPDTAAFHCTWSRVPRTRPASTAVAERIGGSTDNIYFKALGSDMALTFTPQPHQFLLNGENEVLTFSLRPSQYSVVGELPIIAKCTLDPNPYFDKPKKNYAVKLRDAAKQVTGRLLFSLLVHEVEGGHERGASADRMSRSPPSPASESFQGCRISLPRNPARDRLFKTSSPRQPSLGSGTPVKVPETVSMMRTQASGREQRLPTSAAASVAALTPNGGSSAGPSARINDALAALGAQAEGAVQASSNSAESIDVQFERIAVRSEGIDLDHPAPLLLGGEYSLKLRYGSFTYSTTQCLCANPKEVEYQGQQTCITLQSPPSAEKLRFSLWEVKKQVGGFSLDPAKFTVSPGVWKEYAIPFRYHPTGQKAVLDVRVRRLVAPLRGSPAGRHACTPPSHREPTMTTSATEPIAFSADDATPCPPNCQAELQSRRRDAGVDAVQQRQEQQQQQHLLSTSSSPPEREAAQRYSPLARGGRPSPPGSILVTRGAVERNSSRDTTPLRFNSANSDRSTPAGLHGGNVATLVVRGGWVRTPLSERPPPLTKNLADLPADRRPPDDHESYISEVLARLDRQARGRTRPQTSLMEEWIGWRDERERSRHNSSVGLMMRSSSLSSVGSCADSVASVSSRRASVPRATKSNADHSLLTPFTPDNGALRRRYRSPSPIARLPLV
ncbi:hypothetical protein ABL78_0302 [Leptomonas seymouri]|uniref:Uncharacterized protein n=1 Tax=Leptomonas seymouri TaxID=5684 RepID=A0A0N1IMS1_LEPSE|nr:hypothetical protein ABL78_0302 [Leptomonas seymouri]|eukprot:KPI90542.1 hypothetical protein ABL78_0302 [Leptomonas seymouri]